MSTPIFIGALIAFPSLALWGSGPRRRWPAWACVVGSALLWGMGFIWAGANFWIWLGSGAWSCMACLYACYIVQRNAGEYTQLESSLDEREKAHVETSRSLELAKSRSKGIETEQREVQALYGMIKGLAEALTWDDLRPKIELAVQQYLGVEAFAFYVVGHAEDKPYPLVRRRLGSSLGSSWETLERCFQERGLSSSVSQLFDAPLRAVTVPIFENQKLTGYFYARIPEGLDPKTLLAKAQTFFDEIAFAFNRIRLFQEVERFSQIDGLTGVYRRGRLDEKIQEEVLRAQTFKTTFCLILLDIDHFKVLNDKYGHPFGDFVLQRIGQILQASVYETDFVARYGGEEFAILLPRAEPLGVRRKAESVRRAVEEGVFELAMERVHVTASMGIAHFPRDGSSAEAVLRQADQALYYAKETGRNRVVDIVEVPKSP